MSAAGGVQGDSEEMRFEGTEGRTTNRVTGQEEVILQESLCFFFSPKPCCPS